MTAEESPQAEFTYKLMRFSSAPCSTESLLMAGCEEGDMLFRCFALEDEHRDVKVAGKTRIPAGRYEIKPRTKGMLYLELKKKYPWHDKGMLWLQNVPGFNWIYLHSGNRHGDTSGCILVGDSLVSNVEEVGEGFVSYSVNAYRRLYNEIHGLLENKVRVFLLIEDLA